MCIIFFMLAFMCLTCFGNYWTYVCVESSLQGSMGLKILSDTNILFFLFSNLLKVKIYSLLIYFNIIGDRHSVGNSGVFNQVTRNFWYSFILDHYNLIK